MRSNDKRHRHSCLRGSCLFGAGEGVFKSTDAGATWGAVNAGLPNGTVVIALAIDPNTPQILYAAGLGLIDTGGVFSGGVFAIEQISACVGDCNDSSAVTIDELLTMVNIALGNAQPSVCPSDPPIGGEINVAVIIQAVNNALKGCGAGE